MRRVLVIAFVLLVAVAAPASAAPDNSPVFEEQTFLADDFWLPNPCLGDDVWEPYRFEGRVLLHEFENPSGKEHLNDVGYIAASTPSGFTSPEKMIGVDVVNENGNTITETATGLYQLRNDDGQKLRVQARLRVTVVDGETKVESLAIDVACLGTKR